MAAEDTPKTAPADQTAANVRVEPPAGGWRIGVNVPWVAPWSAELDFGVQPSKSFPGKVEVVQRSEPGVGAPVLDGMHVDRQRRGVVDHLCHVCGRPTPRNDRYLFPVATGVFVPMHDGSQRYASHLPPIHLECAKLAQQACPHLRTTYARPDPYPRDASEILCETSPPPYMAALAQGIPPGRKVIFSYFRLYSPEYSRHVERLRDAPPLKGRP